MRVFDVTQKERLTEPLADSLTAFFPAAMLLQAGQSTNAWETELLVDEEEEDGQRHDEDAHCRQEADGLWGDWQEEGEGEGTHNDTLIRPHKQTAWKHTHTHTQYAWYMWYTDTTGDTLVFEIPPVPCSKAKSSAINRSRKFTGLNKQLAQERVCSLKEFDSQHLETVTTKTYKLNLFLPFIGN